MFNITKSLFDRSKKYLNEAEKDFKKVQEFKEQAKNLSLEEMRKRIDEIKEEFKLLVKDVPEEEQRSLRQFKRQGDIPTYEQVIFDKVFEVMPEVYSYVDQVFYRKSGHYYHDVQIKAAIILAKGQRLVEMKTGEGKTRTFVLPLALYSLVGRGAHLATVNDYLSKVGAEYVGHFMAELGITVGIVTPSASYKFVKDEDLKSIKGEEAAAIREEQSIQIDSMNEVNLIEVPKKDSYVCDITYGTNNEFGFDYLRDNMATNIERLAQRELYFCIIDEADSILIDEARTPLIISATPSDSDTDKYARFAKAVQNLTEEEDYIIDHKARSASLTEEGIQKVEDTLQVANLWDDFSMAYHLENALKAKALYTKGDQYLVRKGEVLIVDEFTGRVMGGRRYSEGLHQAIEAKEGVEIKQETKTFATVTFQNFFRMYKVLCGGSGTIMTESEEFYKIYGLESIEIPTNKPNIRIDHPDRIYRNQEAKFKAVVDDVIELHKAGRPILIGTASVDKSEIVSELLDEAGIKHEVLNAKYHESESKIVTRAGKKGAVTVATNMAGRGTDIVVGGGQRGDDAWQEIIDLGGLFVVGTERHDSRRIDNQLRGRTGRQGEAGETRFYVSMDDQIMRVLGGEMMARLLNMTGMDEDKPLEMKMLSNQIETAQKRVEGMHFDSRKNVVEYDDVMNQHREIFYSIRQDMLITSENAIGKFREGSKIIDLNLPENADLKDEYSARIDEKRDRLMDQMKERLMEETKHIVAINTRSINEANLKELIDDIGTFIPSPAVQLIIDKPQEKLGQHIFEEIKNKSALEIEDYFLNLVNQIFEKRIEEFGDDLYGLSKVIALRQLDTKWVDHLEIMKDIREGIKLQGYAQKNPLVEYKNKAFEIFGSFIKTVNSEIAKQFIRLRKATAQDNIQLAQNIRTNDAAISDVTTGDREFNVQSNRSQAKNLTKNLESQMNKEQATMRTNNKGGVSKPQTVSKSLKYGRNDKVTVKYANGDVKKDVKFKKVEADIESGNATIVS